MYTYTFSHIYLFMHSFISTFIYFHFYSCINAFMSTFIYLEMYLFFKFIYSFIYILLSMLMRGACFTSDIADIVAVLKL